MKILVPLFITVIIIVIICVIIFRGKQTKSLGKPINIVQNNSKQRTPTTQKSDIAVKKIIKYKSLKELRLNNKGKSKLLSDNKIPKIIHQTWYTYNVPENTFNVIQKMLDENPDYVYIFYDDDAMYSYINNCEFPGVKKAIDMLENMAAKADLFRYVLMYYIGGVYLDIDSSIKPLDQLIKPDDIALVTREGTKERGSLMQWCMIYTPGHPLMKKLIEQCVDKILNKKTTDVVYLTGPCLYAQVANDLYGINVYWEKDKVLNKMLNGICRFIGVDFDKHGDWKYHDAHLLYEQKPHWWKVKTFK